MSPRTRRRFLGVLIPGSLATAWAATIEGWFLRQPGRIRARAADDLAVRREAVWEDATITARDGAALHGWLFTPRRHHGRAVLLVHGGGGSRHWMLSRADWHLKAGYICLVVDQRGCGESGGVISHGVHEPDDTVRWARWLRERTGAAAVFGHGASRGSTTLIQSLALTHAGRPAFDAIAAECAGVGNVARPYAFIADRLGGSETTARWAAGAFIEPSFAWIRWRHGFDMRSAPRGVDAVRGSRVPLLLIQGSDDHVTPLAGARRLRDANPARVELDIVPGVGHDWFGRGQPVVMERIGSWLHGRDPLGLDERPVVQP